MGYKLICFDMSGVLIEDMDFWMSLHEAFCTYEKGKMLTEKYLHTNYEKLVEEVVVKLWKGKDAQPYEKLVNSFTYMQGIKEIFAYLKQQGYFIAIITGSCYDVARKIQETYPIDFIFGNALIIKNNKVSGEFLWPIGAKGENKGKILKHLCETLNIQMQESIYIGDNEIDKHALKIAGFSIAFNAKHNEIKEIVLNKKGAIVDSNNLEDILPILQGLEEK